MNNAEKWLKIKRFIRYVTPPVLIDVAMYLLGRNLSRSDRDRFRIHSIRAGKFGFTFSGVGEWKRFLSDPSYADKKLTRLNIAGACKRVNLGPGVGPTFVEVILDDTYQLEKIEIPEDECVTILDIGANVGVFCLAAKKRFPNATIHCYEAYPLLEQWLKVQAAATGAKYFMEAIGLEDGKGSRDNRENEILDITSGSIIRPDPSGRVSVTSFRRAIDRLGGGADLVKLDCEGGEWLIFKDFDTWQSVRNVVLEYHRFSPDNSFDRFDKRIDIHQKTLDSLKSLGFSIRYINKASIDNGIIWASR